MKQSKIQVADDPSVYAGHSSLKRLHFVKTAHVWSKFDRLSVLSFKQPATLNAVFSDGQSVEGCALLRSCSVEVEVCIPEVGG